MPKRKGAWDAVLQANQPYGSAPGQMRGEVPLSLPSGFGPLARAGPVIKGLGSAAKANPYWEALVTKYLGKIRK